MNDLASTSQMPEQVVVQSVQKPKRGRPAGQFNYHKDCVLRFLQEHVASADAPYEGTNEELAAAIGTWDNQSGRMEVSARQVARYLRKLQDETTTDGKTRIEIALHRFKGPQGQYGTVRRINVNDTKLVQI